MSPSLRLLLWMRLRGRVRLIANRFGAMRSALLTVVAILLALSWLGGIVVAIIFGSRRHSSGFAQMAEQWGAPAIFAAWVFTLLVGGKTGALAFTPADTDQLFPGPFRRRELVLYRIGVQSFGALVSGVFAGLWIIMNAGTPLGGWLGLVLLMLFLQFSNIAMSIAREAGGTRLKVVVGALVLAFAGFVGVKAEALGGDVSKVVPTLKAIRESRVVSALLTPLEPFGHAAAATETPTALLYALACLGLVLLMVALILRLDAVSLEASMIASQKVQAKIERMRRGRVVFKPTQSVQVPMLRLPGRAGPIAWRHLTGVVRSGAWLFVPVALVAGYVVAGVDREGAEAILPVFVAMIAFALPNMLRFDFRADIDHIDVLKTLPLAPVAVALGQLAAPVAVIACMVWALAIGAAVRDPATGSLMLPVCVAAPLVGMLLMASENFLFLVYPYRTGASGVMDVRHMLRGIVGQFAKVAVFVLAAGPAGLIAWGAHSAGLGWTGAATCAAVFMMGECVGMLFIVAWAFDRFDPARDMPA